MASLFPCPAPYRESHGGGVGDRRLPATAPTELAAIQAELDRPNRPKQDTHAPQEDDRSRSSRPLDGYPGNAYACGCATRSTPRRLQRHGVAFPPLHRPRNQTEVKRIQPQRRRDVPAAKTIAGWPPGDRPSNAATPMERSIAWVKRTSTRFESGIDPTLDARSRWNHHVRCP